MSKWKAPVFYTAIGALVGSTLMAGVPALAGQNPFQTFQASLNQDGQTVSKPSAIVYDGTSYFGIWWLQQQLQKDGIDVTWDGKTLSLTNMPVQQSNTLSVTGSSSSSTQSPIFANTVTVNGVTYVPLNEVQDLLKQSGSALQFKTKDDGEDSSNSGQSGSVSYEGEIHKLQDISEKLSEFESKGGHGDGHGEGEAFSSFAGSLMQLQSVIDDLNQASGSQTSTSGTTSTSSTGTSSSTSTGTSTSGTSSTGTNSTGTGSQSTTGTTGTQTSGSAPQVSDIVTSLQTDWKSLDTFALQYTQGNTSASTSSLPGIISDINTQIKALSALDQNQQSGDSKSGDNQSDN